MFCRAEGLDYGQIEVLYFADVSTVFFLECSLLF